MKYLFKKGHKINVGRKHSEKWKQELSDKMKGNKYALGIKQSKETIEKRAKKLFGTNRTTGNYKRIIVECAYCEKELIRRKYRTKKRNYCNASHQLKYEYENGMRERKPHGNLYIAHKKKCSGSNNYMWKGGGLPYPLMNDTEWHKVRKEVYKRDKWTCQICRRKCDKKRKISCHHIVPYRATLDNSKENLITLCARCHRKEEIKYHRKLRGQVEFDFS